MDNRTVRAGIVGAGFAAGFHFAALRKVHTADVRVVGVFNRTPERGRAFAAERGIRAFDSLEALLEQVDAVHVCTPAASHEAIAVAALQGGRHAVVEKPLTGYFGDGREDFDARGMPRQEALDRSLQAVERMLAAERASPAKILYAENWVYAPAVQKEREILTKTGGQILWLHGEEAHSGSHSAAYGHWRLAGGGSLMGKGCHPLTAALYLKAVEGRARGGEPIRPAAVSARVHELSRLRGFRDAGHIRTDYHDVEDFSLAHVVFEDGTPADVFASEIVLGGVHNWLEVAANNHRTICRLNPNSAMQTFSPKAEYFRDVYTNEKIETKAGWAFTSPDEDWFSGYQQEIDAFYGTIAHADPPAPESDSRLAANTISTIYSAYLSAERKGAEVPVKAF